MYLKILQKLRCLIPLPVVFQNRPRTPIGCNENFVNFEFLEGQFCKEELPLSTKRKLPVSILLNFSFPSVSFSGVFLTLKGETLVLQTTAIELSLFCLTFEDFCLGLKFSLGPRDLKHFSCAE